ncbi:MAG: aspartate kinase [Alloprevotella sp.]|nr:aspartate kinase [Alloprevotella sp.]MDY6297057.1 aspartate kinase [Alloprevotella sp.]
MKVQKFGGTSVGSPERMKAVGRIVTSEKGNIVVLSAMSGTTNSLVEIANYFEKGNPEAANITINQLRNKYSSHIAELYTSGPVRQRMADFLDDRFTLLHTFSSEEYTEQVGKTILAQGEIISTNMVTAYLNEQGNKVKLLSALDFMRLGENGEPDQGFLRRELTRLLEENPGYDLYITQGFIARNANGEVDNLQRGGSDYTACLIGAAMRAEEIQIWTDIDGMHNNDPRFVKDTDAVHQLSFEEAAELAYFGAKILHPTCILPARYANVPVRILNTMEPQAEGTMVNNQLTPNVIKAVAAKDDITVIKIVSSRMLLAAGFLHMVFEIFEKHQTSIDMITTSEVGVSLTIDNKSHLAAIVDELKQYGTVVVEHDMCIVCVVGDLRYENRGLESKITQALEDIPLRMISFGGSDHNISFLVRQADKQKALQALSDHLFRH